MRSPPAAFTLPLVSVSFRWLLAFVASNGLLAPPGVRCSPYQAWSSPSGALVIRTKLQTYGDPNFTSRSESLHGDYNVIMGIECIARHQRCLSLCPLLGWQQADQKLKFLAAICTACGTATMDSSVWDELYYFQWEVVDTIQVRGQAVRPQEAGPGAVGSGTALGAGEGLAG